MFYVRYIPICSYTINKITFIINTLTTIIIIVSITFNFNITIIIIIIIIIVIVITTNIIKSTIVIIILSFVLLFFDIRSLCVTFIFEFICVLFTTFFLLFTGFRCDILLKNIHIDLLLLALGFLKNFSTFNKRYSKFIMRDHNNF